MTRGETNIFSLYHHCEAQLESDFRSPLDPYPRSFFKGELASRAKGNKLFPMLKIILIFAGLALLAVVAGMGCQSTRNGYDSAPYKVARQSGNFEVREYPALTLAETPMPANASNGSFRRLFNFISGQNAARQKIAMTTPVFFTGSSTNAAMSFVMPSPMAADQVPVPADPAVKIRVVEPGRFAVLRFKGGRNSKNEAAALARLRLWMTENALVAQAEPVFGYFDPPWTLPVFRRNEVMIRLAP